MTLVFSVHHYFCVFPVIHSDILSRQAVNSLIGAVYRCLSLFVSGIDRSAFEVFPCPYIPYVCYLDVLWRFLLFPVFIAFTLLWCVLSETLSYSLWMHLEGCSVFCGFLYYLIDDMDVIHGGVLFPKPNLPCGLLWILSLSNSQLELW